MRAAVASGASVELTLRWQSQRYWLSHEKLNLLRCDACQVTRML
jgi:hypothetical protein